MSVSSVTTVDTTYSVRLDQADSNTLYIGESPTGSAEANSVWRIRKFITAGTVSSFLWADGNQQFDNIWNNRTSLTYS